MGKISENMIYGQLFAVSLSRVPVFYLAGFQLFHLAGFQFFPWQGSSFFLGRVLVVSLGRVPVVSLAGFQFSLGRVPIFFLAGFQLFHSGRVPVILLAGFQFFLGQFRHPWQIPAVHSPGSNTFRLAEVQQILWEDSQSLFPWSVVFFLTWFQLFFGRVSMMKLFFSE